MIHRLLNHVANKCYIIPSILVNCNIVCISFNDCLIVVEFIYAQSPGYMKGLLLGCLFSTEGFAMLLGSLLFVVLSKIDSSVFRTFNICYSEDICKCIDDDNGFAIGLYAVVVVIALISFVMFRYAVHKYVIRKRDRDQKYFTM